MTSASHASNDNGGSRDDLRPDHAIATRAEHDVRALAQAFEHAAQRVRHQRAGGATGAPVSDPDAVHDLRVAIRRLIAALGLWRPVLKTSARRSATRALRTIRVAFGPVRELEVHATRARAHLRQSCAAAAEHAAIAALERSLRQRYPRVRSDALATVSSRRVRDISQDVTRAFEDLRNRWEKPRRRARVADRLKDARANALKAIGAACEPGLSTEAEEFHRARIAIKKWRYVTERAAQATGATDVPIERLRELQSALGHARDAITFAGEIARFVARSKPRQTALASVSAALHAKAQEQAEHFLDQVAGFEASVKPKPPAAPGAKAKARSSRPKRTATRGSARPDTLSSRKPSSRAAG